MQPYDVLIPGWIEKETPRIAWPRLEVIGFEEIDSTNEEAIRRCRSGAKTGTVIIAESQTSGRGRLGRQWFSPPAAGLYVSILIYPEQPLIHWPLLGMAAAVAMAEAIMECIPESRKREIELKWPNDILVSGKKVCGILMETAGSTIRGAVIGCGVNVRKQEFPEEITGRATALESAFGQPIQRRLLLVKYLTHLQIVYDYFQTGEFHHILARWKSLSNMMNETSIWVVEHNQARPAVTCGLSEYGGLRIRNESGTEEIIMAGDIKIRAGSLNENDF